MPGVSIFGENRSKVAWDDSWEVLMGVGGATKVADEGRIEVDRIVKGPIENDDPLVRTYVWYDWFKAIP